jgi:hypothetical protein
MQLIPFATKMAILQPNIGVVQGIIPSSVLTDKILGGQDCKQESREAEINACKV